jgi:hypothetical protein
MKQIVAVACAALIVGVTASLVVGVGYMQGGCP